MFRVGVYAAELYEDTELLEQFKEGYRGIYEQYDGYLLRSKANIRKDHEWLQTIASDPFVINAVRCNPNFQWYYTGLNNYYYMFA